MLPFIASRFNAFGRDTPTYIVSHFNAFGRNTPTYIVFHFNAFGRNTPNKKLCCSYLYYMQLLKYNQ